MSANAYLPAHYPVMYDTNWAVLTQELLTRLKEFVQVETVSGLEKQFNQIGSKEWQPITSRGSDTINTDTPTGKRVLRATPFGTSELFDEFDAMFLGNIVLPTSDLMVVQGAGYNRLIDRVIITSALGSAVTITTPLTDPNNTNGYVFTPLPTTGGPGTYNSGQFIPVDYQENGTTGTNFSMTLGKLRYAKYFFDENDVDESEDRVIALCAKEVNSLLRDTQIGSRDWNDINAWNDGKLDKFMGFRLKRVSSSVNPAVGGIRVCPAWVKSGIKLGDSGKRAYMDVLPTKNHALQMRASAAVGGTRMEEKKVVGIRCDTSLA